MKATRALPATALLVVLAYTPARADCQCFANGKRYHHGEVACLDMPAGRQFAQCGMVLNNSAWLKVQDGCPVARAHETPDIVHGATHRSLPVGIRLTPRASVRGDGPLTQ